LAREFSRPYGMTGLLFVGSWVVPEYCRDRATDKRKETLAVLELVRRIHAGETDRAIARDLGVAPKTVEKWSENQPLLLEGIPSTEELERLLQETLPVRTPAPIGQPKPLEDQGVFRRSGLEFESRIWQTVEKAPSLVS
jgi:hypothetical protein